jgi:hypothetical protein
MMIHVRRSMLPVVVLMAAMTVGLVGASSAAAASPWWHLTSSVRPASIQPGQEGSVVVLATNFGDAPTVGPVTLSDVLPLGVSVLEEGGAPRVSFFAYSREGGHTDFGPHGIYRSAGKFCKMEATPERVTCTTRSPSLEAEAAELGQETPFALAPYEYLEMRLAVKVESSAIASNESEAAVTGGATPPASLMKPVVSNGPAASFGVEEFSLVPEEEGGAVDAQAGSHPFQLATTFALNQGADLASPPALPRNLQFKLPAGLVGNATAVPECSDLDFANVVTGGFVNRCPEDTAIGVAVITVDEPNHLSANLGPLTAPVPLYNLTPEPGEPARFGFEFAQAPITLDTSVRTGSDYGVTVHVSNITQLANFLSATVAFWGVPGSSSHDESRGWGCLASGHFGLEAGQTCLPSAETDPPPFLTLPTSCSASFATSVEGVSWPTPADPAGVPLPSREYSLQDSFGRTLGMTGCNQLPFDPAIEVAPDVQSTSSPTGLKVNVHVPQEVNENGGGLASSNVKNISVTLPEGVSLNPAGANGLEACSEAQVGYEHEEQGTGRDLFSATLPSPFCPDASKVGTVKITSPLIANPLEGAVYLASQGANPFGSLVAMYIVAEDPVSGTLVKLPGEVHLSETGQVSATFNNNPQLPFEDAELHFFGGERAPLSTPAHCGTYTTQASFAPWSGNEPVGSSSSFEINTGPNGSACPGASLPFSPSLTAGTTNINAGAFSPLVTTIGREDGQQNIQAVQLHMPPGLSGILTGVPLCGEAEANAGSCGAGSQIGSTIVSVGLGGDPYSVTGGKVYLTGPYQGAPFGLSIVNPAVAGPFNLGQVVVRAKIEVDPLTAALTITTGTIPHILDGIPLQIKHVNVTISRPGFTFNPTNCSPMSITGSIGSVEGASSAVQEHFQATNCASLKFAPKFAVSTKGRTTKKLGASLTAKVTEPAGSMGSQANIARVKVDLPIQLPSQLKTLQKACPAKTFEEGFEECLKDAPHSKVGEAVVYTPLLPVPLRGPAIFVSHGGEAFPSLTVVLQGYGVTIDLVGATDIKGGITSTTFKTVPDVPFSTFELTIPQGEYAALAVNLPEKDHGDLCGQNLKMPTEFLAQNGAKINEDTPISISGCPKVKALTRAQKLQKALKACKKKKGAKRKACEASAHKKYGPLKKGSKQKRRKK